MTANRSVIAAMYVGLTVTVMATVAAYVDQATSNVLADHIRSGYPSDTQGRIDTAVDTYLVYLSVVGALGVVGWLGAIHIVKKGKRYARTAATTMFVIGVGVALFDLLINDTFGDAGIPHVLGVIGLLPCLPGLLAVTMVWRNPRQPTQPPSSPAACARFESVLRSVGNGAAHSIEIE